MAGPSPKAAPLDAAGMEDTGGEWGGGLPSGEMDLGPPFLPRAPSSLALAVEIQGYRVSLLPAPGECGGHSSGDGPSQAFIQRGITTWLTLCPLHRP